MKKFFTLLISAAALISCGKEPVSVEVSAGQYARFKINEIDTKAYLTDGYKICWEAEKDDVSIFCSADNCRFRATSGGDGDFWLEGSLSKLSSIYYAIYPYNEEATNRTGFATTTIPSNQKAIPNQFSNIVAVASTKTNELHFKNCVSLVEVDLQTDGIKTIRFKGNNGELIAGKVRISIPSKDEGEPVCTVISGAKEVSISDGESILQKGTYYLAVIPQTFSKGITVTLEGDGARAVKYTSKTVTATRSKRLLTGNLALETVNEDNNFFVSFDDGEQSGKVWPGENKVFFYSYSGINSFRYSVKSSGYSAEYFLDGSETPADASSRIGTGFTGESGVLNILPASPAGGDNQNNAMLRTAAARGSKDNPVDLSTDNSTLPGLSLNGINTANCYIVRAPGWYSFPLVYGNAIKNGSPNTNAYAPDASGERILSPFIGADGKAITSPYINEGSDKVTSARIEWQDALGLIADEVSFVKGSGKDDRIVFNVPAGTIREGNAVISAIDADGLVVWSWHIWVCGASASELQPVTVTNKASKDFGFMRFNLGWVAKYSSPIEYPERSIRVRLTENGTGKVINLSFVLSGASLPANETGFCPFWQWGRKDPFVAGDGTLVKDASDNFRKKTWYTTARRDTVGTRAALLDRNIANFIRHPSQYNINSGGDNTYTNTWNALQDKLGATDVIVKTIYDPCPVGYCLPPMNAWSAFSATNISEEFNGGWYFWSKPDKGGEPVFYPATGSMSTSDYLTSSVFGSLRNVGTHCSYWSGNPNQINNAGDANSSYYLSAYKTSSASGVYTIYGSNRQSVYPIRPCIEQ